MTIDKKCIVIGFWFCIYAESVDTEAFACASAEQLSDPGGEQLHREAHPGHAGAHVHTALSTSPQSFFFFFFLFEKINIYIYNTNFLQ